MLRRTMAYFVVTVRFPNQCQQTQLFVLQSGMNLAEQVQQTLGHVQIVQVRIINWF